MHFLHFFFSPFVCKSRGNKACILAFNESKSDSLHNDIAQQDFVSWKRWMLWEELSCVWSIHSANHATISLIGREWVSKSMGEEVWRVSERYLFAHVDCTWSKFTSFENQNLFYLRKSAITHDISGTDFLLRSPKIFLYKIKFEIHISLLR